MYTYTETFFTHQDYAARESEDLCQLMNLLAEPVMSHSHYNEKILATTKLAQMHHGTISYKQAGYKKLSIVVAFPTEEQKNNFENCLKEFRGALILAMLITQNDD